MAGTVNGPFRNNNVYAYGGGTFNGRLANYGMVNFNVNFTAGNGLANYSDLTVPAGPHRCVERDGPGQSGDARGKRDADGFEPLHEQRQPHEHRSHYGRRRAYTQTAGTTINNGTLTRRTIDNIQGGTFGGNGTINGAVIVGSGAVFFPGNSPGTITINGDLASSGTWVFEIAGLSEGAYDVLNVSGSATFTGGTLRFEFLNGFTPHAGDTWTFFLANTITGWNTLTFDVNGLAGGQTWRFVDVAGGKAFQVTSFIPVPAGLWLFAPALDGLFALRKKITRKRNA